VKANRDARAQGRFQRIVGTRHISPPISARGAHHLRRVRRTHGLCKSKSTRSHSVIRSGYGMDFVTQAFSRRGLPNELVKSPRNVEPTGTGAPSSDLLATQRGRNLDPARLIKEPGTALQLEKKSMRWRERIDANGQLAGESITVISRPADASLGSTIGDFDVGRAYREADIYTLQPASRTMPQNEKRRFSGANSPDRKLHLQVKGVRTSREGLD